MMPTNAHSKIPLAMTKSPLLAGTHIKWAAESAHLLQPIMVMVVGAATSWLPLLPVSLAAWIQQVAVSPAAWIRQVAVPMPWLSVHGAALQCWLHAVLPMPSLSVRCAALKRRVLGCA